LRLASKEELTETPEAIKLEMHLTGTTYFFELETPSSMSSLA